MPIDRSDTDTILMRRMLAEYRLDPVHNKQMAIFQRVAAQNVVAGAVGNAHVPGVFGPDRWGVSKDGTGTGVITQTPLTVGQGPSLGMPYNPFAVLNYNFNVAGAGGTFNRIIHSIEDVDIFEGEVVTLSMYAHVLNVSNLIVTPLLVQYFGTGVGGGSGPIGITSYNSPSWNVLTGTTYQRYDASFVVPPTAGKTVSNSATDALHIVLDFPPNTAFQFLMTNVQLEPGPTFTRFFARRPDDELLLCQRFYQKSFSYGTAPAQNAGAVGAAMLIEGLAGAVAQGLAPAIPLFPPMRAVPAVILFNPAAANAQARDFNAAADCTATVANANTSEKEIVITTTPPAGGAIGHTLGVHWTASAEI